MDFFPNSGVFVYGFLKSQGSPRSWAFEVMRRPNGFRLNVFTGTSVQLNQSTAWSFHLPLGGASIGAHLRVAGIHTGAALGSFGRIDLTYVSFRRLRRHGFRCGSTGRRIDTDLWRLGTFSGSFDFTPNQGTLPDVHATRMSAVTDQVLAHRPCPPTHPKPRCEVRRTISVVKAADGTRAIVAQTPGGAAFDLSRSLVTRPARTYSLIDAFPYSGAVVTRAGLTIDSVGLPTALSGSLEFESGGVRHSRGPLCRITTTDEIWSAGDLMVNFDSGATDLTGPALHAHVVSFTRP